MAGHESLLSYAKSRYLWAALGLLAVSSIVYIRHDPGGPANGGTWLGYTLGTISALLVAWLMYFGVRKRSYDGPGTLRGWLSAHVYLGTALILLVLLHAGFQVGWNLHTFTFVLLLLVIFSGFFGVYAYLRYPGLMTRNRDSATRAAMLEEIAEIDRNALQLADGLGSKIHAIVLRSVQKTRLGGGVWAQLRARDDSETALTSLYRAVEERQTQLAGSTTGPPNTASTIFAMVDFLVSNVSDQQTNALRSLIDMLTRKKSLAGRVARDIQYQAIIDIWLYVHVPLSFALLAALIGHIVFSLFYL
jgi:hypothetical protein